MGGARPLGWKAGAMEGSSGTQDSSCRTQPAGVLAYGVRVGKKTDCQVQHLPYPTSTMTQCAHSSPGDM